MILSDYTEPNSQGRFCTSETPTGCVKVASELQRCMHTHEQFDPNNCMCADCEYGKLSWQKEYEAREGTKFFTKEFEEDAKRFVDTQDNNN